MSPKNVVIYWGKDPDEKQVLEKHFVVETNLGGLKAFQNINGTLTPKTSGSTAQVGDAPSRLEINYDNTPDEDGKYLMKVKETVDPKTTTVYNFTLSPLKDISGDEDRSQEVTVTVKPEFGPYRIYMRAINDIYSWDLLPHSKTGILKYTLKSQHPEYTGPYGGYDDNKNYNWDDGWYLEKDNWDGDNSPHNDKHYMYMYTQTGENKNGVTTQAVWIFTNTFPGNSMSNDANNAGWYYSVMNTDAPVKSTQNSASGPKTIKPGQTLVIFGNGKTQVMEVVHLTVFHITWIQVFLCSTMKITKVGISMTQPAYHIIEYMMINLPL